MRATCYVIWTDGSRSHFTLLYEDDEPAGFSSFNEFLFSKCLLLFPGKTREEIKWVIKE